MGNRLKLSDQFVGAIMMAIQKAMLEQEDVVQVLKSFEIVTGSDGLVVTNPPIFEFTKDDDI